MTRLAGVPVVVGVDGSEPSLAALDVAIQEARWRRRPLRLVTAFTGSPGVARAPRPADGNTAGGQAGVATLPGVRELRHLADQRGEAADMLAAFVRRANLIAPDLLVDGDLIAGSASAVLAAEAARATLVVVGHRGRGGCTALLAGSTAVHLASHSRTPVIVVRESDLRLLDNPSTISRPRVGGVPTGLSQRRVVVGVDGSPESDATLDFAFREAALRGIALTVVHAWAGAAAPGLGTGHWLRYNLDEVAADRSQTVSGLIAGYRRDYPEVPVRQWLARESPAEALRWAAQGAQLLVVGRRAGASGPRLGSVSHALLHTAPCPVALARSSAGYRPRRRSAGTRTAPAQRTSVESLAHST